MKNKKILIIGGTGALGKTLTKRYHESNDIMIFSRDEHKQVDMKKQYNSISYQIGDVKDKNSLFQVINEYKPDVVINTAALKHVPICEENPYESVKTNIIGHKNLIDCISSSTHKIKTLMFISTDKACNPINVYGMCKAISERLYLDYSKKQSEIKVVLCRYGNVLESTGSVIPYFKKLLDNGVDFLPVTDKRMTRFLISLEESVDLIDWTLKHQDSHGCIIVPKLKSLMVVDLAKEIGISYNKKNIELRYVGIRPGEKIHEEMISLDESLKSIEYDKYFMITNKIINDKAWSYTSNIDIMHSTDVRSFLINKNVLK